MALLRTEPAFERLRDQVKVIAGLLEEKSTIPMVRDQMPLIQELQTDEWWQDVTTPMLEVARKRIRALVKLIEKRKRKPIYTDFEDQMGAESPVGLSSFAAVESFEKFRDKARAFLREHQDHLSIRKLRMNQPLTPLDLKELERMLVESGVATSEHLQKAKAECEGVGLFVRSLVGLDRETAKQTLSGFTAGKTLSANQIEFVNQIVNHLTEHGVMNPELLYEPPFTDLASRGPEGVFETAEIDELLLALAEVRERAVV